MSVSAASPNAIPVCPEPNIVIPVLTVSVEPKVASLNTLVAVPDGVASARLNIFTPMAVIEPEAVNVLENAPVVAAKAPVSSVLEPLSIFPKPDVIEPEFNAPVVTNEESPG